METIILVWKSIDFSSLVWMLWFGMEKSNYKPIFDEFWVKKNPTLYIGGVWQF